MTLDILQTLDASQRFSYSQLDETAKQIRLVQIRPGQNENSRVQLIIKHVTLNEFGESSFLKHQEGWRFFDRREEPERPRSAVAEQVENRVAGPEFQALSYTWGAVAPACDVYVESHDRQGWFSVRQNLYQFLISRRHKSHQSGWLWIDQICIHQEDETEKGHQVNLMSEIYVRAAKVIVWLGPAFEGSDAAMDFIGLVARQMRDFKGIGREAEGEVYQGVEHHLQALISIAKAPYWSRLWIVQELMLGRDRVFLRLGSKTLHFSSEARPAFKRAINGCLGRIARVQGGFLGFEWRPMGMEPNWYHVYTLAAAQQCYDVRDKAFGMLGLVHPACQFYPDYAMTPQDILLSILRAECRGDDSNDGNGWPEIDITALRWLSLLDKHHDTVDIKAVRRLLHKEAHPAWRKVRQDCWRERRTPGPKGFFDDMKDRYWDSPCHQYVGSGPAWLVQIRLRWMFPNTHSRRWHSKWLHRTSCSRAFPQLSFISENIMDDLSSKEKPRS